MAKIDAGDGARNPLRWSLYFEGDGCFRPPLNDLATPKGRAPTWSDAHDAAAAALDTRAESLTAGRWKYALAYDARRMGELAARVALGAMPPPRGGMRFLAMEQAIRGFGDDLGGERADLEAFGFRFDVIIARALAEAPTPKFCARLAWWLGRWAGLAVEHIAAMEPSPAESASLAAPVYASTRDIAGELLRAARYGTGRRDPGAARVAALAAVIVRELARTDGEPFDGVDLGAAGREVPTDPKPSEAFPALVDRARQRPTRRGDDPAGGAFIDAALTVGWGPQRGDDPTETPWAHWHEHALQECRDREAKRTGRRGDDASRLVRGALAALGHDPDKAAGRAYKVRSRNKPFARPAEAMRSKISRTRKRPAK